MTDNKLVFQTEDGRRYPVTSGEIALLSFMRDGSVFIHYTGGDCDVMAPYVELAVNTPILRKIWPGFPRTRSPQE